MINFNKNELINQTLDKFYDTFSHTLDTSDFVPEKYNAKVSKYIFKNMKKAFRRLDGEDRKYQRKLRKEIKTKEKQNKPQKDFFKNLFKRKHKNADSNKEVKSKSQQ